MSGDEVHNVERVPHELVAIARQYVALSAAEAADPSTGERATSAKLGESCKQAGLRAHVERWLPPADPSQEAAKSGSSCVHKSPVPAPLDHERVLRALPAIDPRVDQLPVVAELRCATRAFLEPLWKEFYAREGTDTQRWEVPPKGTDVPVLWAPRDGSPRADRRDPVDRSDREALGTPRGAKLDIAAQGQAVAMLLERQEGVFAELSTKNAPLDSLRRTFQRRLAAAVPPSLEPHAGPSDGVAPASHGDQPAASVTASTGVKRHPEPNILSFFHDMQRDSHSSPLCPTRGNPRQLLESCLPPRLPPQRARSCVNPLKGTYGAPQTQAPATRVPSEALPSPTTSTDSLFPSESSVNTLGSSDDGEPLLRACQRVPASETVATIRSALQVDPSALASYDRWDEILQALVWHMWTKARGEEEPRRASATGESAPDSREGNASALGVLIDVFPSASSTQKMRIIDLLMAHVDLCGVSEAAEAPEGAADMCQDALYALSDMMLAFPRLHSSSQVSGVVPLFVKCLDVAVSHLDVFSARDPLADWMLRWMQFGDVLEGVNTGSGAGGTSTPPWGPALLERLAGILCHSRVKRVASHGVAMAAVVLPYIFREGHAVDRADVAPGATSLKGKRHRRRSSQSAGRDAFCFVAGWLADFLLARPTSGTPTDDVLRGLVLTSLERAALGYPMALRESIIEVALARISSGMPLWSSPPHAGKSAGRSLPTPHGARDQRSHRSRAFSERWALAMVSALAFPGTSPADTFRIPSRLLREIEALLLPLSQVPVTEQVQVELQTCWLRLFTWYAAELRQSVAVAVRALCGTDSRSTTQPGSDAPQASLSVSPWTAEHFIALCRSSAGWCTIARICSDAQASSHEESMRPLARSLVQTVLSIAVRRAPDGEVLGITVQTLSSDAMWLLMRLCLVGKVAEALLRAIELLVGELLGPDGDFDALSFTSPAHNDILLHDLHTSTPRAVRVDLCCHRLYAAYRWVVVHSSPWPQLVLSRDRPRVSACAAFGSRLESHVNGSLALYQDKSDDSLLALLSACAAMALLSPLWARSVVRGCSRALAHALESLADPTVRPGVDPVRHMAVVLLDLLYGPEEPLQQPEAHRQSAGRQSLRGQRGTTSTASILAYGQLADCPLIELHSSRLPGSSPSGGLHAAAMGTMPATELGRGLRALYEAIDSQCLTGLQRDPRDITVAECESRFRLLEELAGGRAHPGVPNPSAWTADAACLFGIAFYFWFNGDVVSFGEFVSGIVSPAFWLEYGDVDALVGRMLEVLESRQRDASVGDTKSPKTAAARWIPPRELMAYARTSGVDHLFLADVSVRVWLRCDKTPPATQVALASARYFDRVGSAPWVDAVADALIGLLQESRLLALEVERGDVLHLLPDIGMHPFWAAVLILRSEAFSFPRC